MTEDKTQLQQLLKFMEDRSTMALATVGDEGEAQSAPVFFAADHDFNLYFVSDSDSRHSRNLAARPLVSAAIYDDIRHWRDIRGIQLEGLAEKIVRLHETKRAWQVYRAKFPFVAAFATLVRKSAWHKVRPTWVRWIDNRVEFGYKKEFMFDQEH